MADIIYPATLPDFSINKRRDTPQSIVVHTPLRGNAYTEQLFSLGADTPVIYDVSVFCKNTQEAQAFQQFLRTVDFGQVFVKDIKVESGTYPHRVRFVSAPLSPSQVTPNGQWVYSGTIYADRLVTEQNINNCITNAFTLEFGSRLYFDTDGATPDYIVFNDTASASWLGVNPYLSLDIYGPIPSTGNNHKFLVTDKSGGLGLGSLGFKRIGETYYMVLSDFAVDTDFVTYSFVSGEYLVTWNENSKNTVRIEMFVGGFKILFNGAEIVTYNKTLSTLLIRWLSIGTGSIVDAPTSPVRNLSMYNGEPSGVMQFDFPLNDGVSATVPSGTATGIPKQPQYNYPDIPAETSSWIAEFCI